MLALGSGIQDPPKITPYGDLYLLMPPFWQADLGAIPASGILTMTDQVPAWWLPGETFPFQALLGPQSPGSHLTNLMVITVE